MARQPTGRPRGRPRKNLSVVHQPRRFIETDAPRAVHPVHDFLELVETRRGGPRDIQTLLDELAELGCPPPNSRVGAMTAEQKYLFRRSNWLRVFSSRLSKVDYALDQLLKTSDRYRNNFTEKEVHLLVARLRAWVDAIEKSFERGKPIPPVNLPPIVYAHVQRKASGALGTSDSAPIAGLEEVW